MLLEWWIAKSWYRQQSDSVVCLVLLVALSVNGCTVVAYFDAAWFDMARCGSTGALDKPTAN